MLGILQDIWETVTILIEFVINSIQSLIQLILNIPKYLVFITQSISVLPSFLIPFALAFVSIIIVQYILNRKAD